MDRSARLCNLLLLVILALSACAGPSPAPGPSIAGTATVAPTVRPDMLNTAAAATAIALTSTPTLSPIPTPPPSPTPGPPTATLPPPSPTPTAAGPLSPILPQVGPHALLYAKWDASLTLFDLDRPDLWIVLNAGVCPRASYSRVYASWSGDGRFIAFVCYPEGLASQLYLLSLQTGALQKIDAATVIGIKWSPRDSHLLVSTMPSARVDGPGRRTYLLDAATGARLDLPVAASFAETGYAGVGALMLTNHGHQARVAWSPDGTRLAVLGTDAVYVADADGGGGRSFPPAGDSALYEDADWRDGGRFQAGPVWSPDGQTIYVARLMGYKHFSTPSGSVGGRAAAIDLTTGTVQRVEAMPDMYPPPEGSRARQYMDTMDARAPDGAFAIKFVMAGDTGRTIVADAQGQEQITIDSMELFMGWRPMP